MARRDCYDLSVRFQRQTLPAWNGSDSFDARAVDVLQAEASEGAWRIVELGSLQGQENGARPFEARLMWSAGAGPAGEAWVTVNRNTRVSIFARSLRVRAANLDDAENRVYAAISDGQSPSKNQYEETGENGESADTHTHTFPPFAERFLLQVTNSANFTSLVVNDAQGTPRFNLTDLAEQPSAGIPVGGGENVVLSFSASTNYRLLSFLSL